VTVGGAPERMTITRYPSDPTKLIEVQIGPSITFLVRAGDPAEAWSWLMNGVGLPPANAGQENNQPTEPAPTEPMEPAPEPAPAPTPDPALTEPVPEPTPELDPEPEPQPTS
jgi:hypothetical protein